LISRDALPRFREEKNANQFRFLPQRSIEMKKIPRIMVAIDFSQYSKNILAYAGAMAEGMKSELVIVNVINNRDIDALQQVARTTTKFSISGWVETEKQTRRELLQSLIEETSLGHLPTRILIRTGVPFKELMKGVEEEAPQLLVMGSKGRTDIPDVRVGSTAEKALRRCPVPVLSVRYETGHGAE
jgi:nucleotide-binding universal stress UspA family protein